MIEQAVAKELSFDVRVIAMREAIDQMETAINVVRVVTHRLINADLQGAVDVASHALYEMHKAHDTLERQCRDLLDLEAGPLSQTHSGPGGPRSAVSTSSPTVPWTQRRGRRRGIAIVPGSVRVARMEAGLSLAQVAGREVTRVAIWHIEKGKVKPSIETLQLIADRTGKDLDFFLVGGFS